MYFFSFIQKGGKEERKFDKKNSPIPLLTPQLSKTIQDGWPDELTKRPFIQKESCHYSRVNEEIFPLNVTRGSHWCSSSITGGQGYDGTT
jgi:hypothetical protein